MTPISNELFQNSLRHVRRELKTFGFDKPKVMKTKVHRTIIPSLRKQAYFTSDGEIYIPILQSKHHVRDKIRHEYGHSLLFHYPWIMGLRGFSSFGHSAERVDYVSQYAMTGPEEDFCETFMLFLKFKGKLPKRYGSVLIRKKWKFINSLRRCPGSSGS
jgi:hypothetical protein